MITEQQMAYKLASPPIKTLMLTQRVALPHENVGDDLNLRRI